MQGLLLSVMGRFIMVDCQTCTALSEWVMFELLGNASLKNMLAGGLGCKMFCPQMYMPYTCVQDDTEAQQPAVERAISAVLRDASSGRRQSEDFSAGVPDRWTPDWRKIAAASVRQLAWIAQVCPRQTPLWHIVGICCSPAHTGYSVANRARKHTALAAAGCSVACC